MPNATSTLTAPKYPREQRQGPLRKIVALKNPEITSNDPLFRPLVILECGHEVKSAGRHSARCVECGEQQLCALCGKPMRIRPWGKEAFVAYCNNRECRNYRRPIPVQKGEPRDV